jgi:hypothetical protein
MLRRKEETYRLSFNLSADEIEKFKLHCIRAGQTMTSAMREFISKLPDDDSANYDDINEALDTLSGAAQQVLVDAVENAIKKGQGFVTVAGHRVITLDLPPIHIDPSEIVVEKNGYRRFVDGVGLLTNMRYMSVKRLLELSGEQTPLKTSPIKTVGELKKAMDQALIDGEEDAFEEAQTAYLNARAMGNAA